MDQAPTVPNRRLSADPNRLARIAGIASWSCDAGRGRVVLSLQACDLLGVLHERRAFDLTAFIALLAPPDRRELAQALDRAMTEDRVVDRGWPLADGRWRRLIAVRSSDLQGGQQLDGLLQDLQLADGRGTPAARALHQAIDRQAAGVLSPQHESGPSHDGLRVGEAQFRRVLDEAPVGIAVVRPDGDLTLANAAYRHMLGADAESPCGPLSQWLHPDDRAPVAARDAEMLDGRRPAYEYDERYLAANGRETWARVNVTALRNDQGEVTSLVRVAQNISEQKRLATQLRRRESLVRIAGRLALVGGWAVDANSGEFEWSAEVHQIVDWPERQPPPSVDDVWALHPPQWRGPLREALQRCMDQALPYCMDAELVTMAGIHKWVTVAAEPEVDAEGRVRRVVGILQDITAKRRAEDERDRVAAILRDTLEGMSDAFYLLDHDWRFVFVNRQAEKLLDRDATSLLGRALWDAFPEAARMPEFAAYRAAAADGKTRTFEVWDSALAAWFEISVQPSPDGLAVYFREITERKQLTAQLVTSEERFRHVAEATADAVWDWNLQTDTIWWGRGIETLFGFSPEELEPDARSWTTRIHPQDLERVLGGIGEVIDGGGSQWRDEYRFRCKDGRYARVIDRGFVMRNELGQPARMVGSMMDITERLALEDQLRQSQRLESVGQLTGGMAHDFNNLLTVILGNAEVLSENLQREPLLRGLAEMILRAAQQGAELTASLLAFARKQTLEPQPVDANQMLAGMDSLLRRTLGEHIDVQLDCGSGLWTAMADPSQLESAVLNLCINARDAMPTGGRLGIGTANVHLDPEDVHLYPEARPGDYVMIAVSDTGIGVPTELIGRVFEPFFTTKEPGKGTGLGLSMVYGFVRQSHGHITLHSEPGTGTVVQLFLPRHAGAEVQRVTVADQADAAAGTVLLVEDDQQVLQLTKVQLESMGYQVIPAGNVTRALEVLQSQTPLDLLLTDVVMPGGINGRQLAEAARELHPDLPVLFTSGYSDEIMAIDSRPDAAIQLLTKPYRKAELQRRVRAMIRGPAP